MTDTLTTPLPEFEGQEVKYAQVRITNAGDGLSEALEINPVALHYDEEVFYVLRGKVSQVNHRAKGSDADGPLIRVHTVKASQITEVSGDIAKKMLAEAAEQLQKAKADASGQLLLDAENDALAKEAND